MDLDRWGCSVAGGDWLMGERGGTNDEGLYDLMRVILFILYVIYEFDEERSIIGRGFE